jgi:biotin carboxylase
MSSSQFDARSTLSPVTGGCLAVVHPYSTGRLLAPAIARRGWQSIAVVPARPLAVYDHDRVFRPLDYAAVVTDNGNIATMAAELAALGTAAVLAGTESGVPAADALAACLGLPGSDPATSPVRRDKALMVDAVARAGLPHPRTICAASRTEAQAAAAVIGWPVIIKPATSAGSDGVALCRTPDEVAAAWAAAAGQRNVMGEVNSVLLVQEYLTGWQATVNTVTCPDPPRSLHYVAEVWRDHRQVTAGGKIIYDHAELLAGDDPLAIRLGDYTRKILDALGIVTGPAHCELVMTPHRGPVLIELGARLAGMADPQAARMGLGTSQLDLSIEAITEPAAFLALRRDRYRKLSHAVQLDLMAPRTGVLDPGVLSDILALPSVRGWVGHVEPGGQVSVTVDLMTSPGTLYLVGSASTVERDVQRVRELEADLYR